VTIKQIQRHAVQRAAGSPARRSTVRGVRREYVARHVASIPLVAEAEVEDGLFNLPTRTLESGLMDTFGGRTISEALLRSSVEMALPV
jgi:hypothetical protein